MSLRVLVVVEGETERAVLTSTVAPHLGALGISLQPKIVGKPGHKGGVQRGFEAVAKEITNLFKQEERAVVSTFFDFYGLPPAWPGVAEAKAVKAQGAAKPSEIACVIEREWKRQIDQRMSDWKRPLRFIPYVQMHELEALLFTGPHEMADVFLQPKLAERFGDAVNECGGCEDINDLPNSAPSKRIEHVFKGYRKGRHKGHPTGRGSHAAIITRRIGMDRLRKGCPHFGEWIEALESLR